MKFCISSSEGKGEKKLTSFDNALLNSGIANYNLVKISSILPPNADFVEKVDLPEGSVLHTAFASLTSNKAGALISAAVAVGIPKDRTKIGVIMEFSDFCTKEIAEKQVKAMVVESMKNRGYEIEKILCATAEARSDGVKYVSAFAALSIW